MIYSVFLDNNKIATSLLENSDAPMGVVYGELKFIDKILTYEFFSKYCKDNSINTDEYPEDRFISTQTIPTLKVLNENGIEIKGVGCCLAGLDKEGFEITILGIPYPFFEDEFPHHVKAYKNLFK